MERVWNREDSKKGEWEKIGWVGKGRGKGKWEKED